MISVSVAELSCVMPGSWKDAGNLSELVLISQQIRKLYRKREEKTLRLNDDGV